MRKVLFLLGQLNDNDVEWLIAKGCKEEIPAGTVLIREGTPISRLYVVLDGTLAVSVSGLGEKPIARMGAGEVVGEISFVDADPPAATVTALAKSVVLSIPREELLLRLQQDQGFAARFYRAIAVFLSHRLRATVRRLGYGKETQADALDADELDPQVLDNIHLAGSRFGRILQSRMGE